MIMCVQKEERPIMKVAEGAYTVTKERTNPKLRKKRKGKIPPQEEIKKESKCFFCKKKGHKKNDCPKFKKQLEKKGNSISFIYYESDMVVNHDTWQVDYNSIIHVTNTLQGLQNLKKPLRSEQYIFSRSKNAFTRCGNQNMQLDFEPWFCFSFKKGILYSKFIEKLGFNFKTCTTRFSFNISNKFCNFYCKYNLIGNSTMSDDLFRLILQNNIFSHFNACSSSIKWCLVNEKNLIISPQN